MRLKDVMKLLSGFQAQMYEWKQRKKEYQQKSKIFRNHYFGYLNYGNIEDS